MAWHFRRRVKIISGIHLNFSRSGISTSIGVKGANMTIGNRGTYLNVGVPALGIYNRQRISGRKTQNIANPTPYKPLPQIERKEHNIYSADIHTITSDGMQGVKELILLAREQRLSLANDLSKINSAIRFTKAKKVLSYVFIFGLLKKDIPRRLTSDLMAQKEAVKQAKGQIQASYVNVDIDFDEDMKQKYEALASSFHKLTKCQKIWDVTSSHYEDRIVTRSSASTVVKRTTVHFEMRSIPEFKSDLKALYFQNANGADLYIYPSFIVMYSRSKDLAIIGLDELRFQHSFVRFTETEGVPSDSKVIGQTWAKVNKNGSRDKRFKGNYQIPIAQYGEIMLRTATGVHEEYQFSNAEALEAFSNAFKNYQNAVRQLAIL